MEPHQYFRPLLDTFEKHSDKENAIAMSAYMKNNFPFFGIKSENRRTIQKEFLKQHPLTNSIDTKALVNYLFAIPQREAHYAAIEMAVSRIKLIDRESIELIEWMIINNSWWDSVDTIATKMAGKYFEKYPDEIYPHVEKWLAGNNMWLKRTALIFQLNYGIKTDAVLLFDLCTQLKGSNEFFIQKAIGWSLRQYAKKNSASVNEFVNNTALKPLSKREALKHFSNE
ncbi:MAG: DNA alkylation repair protein [Bacteroidia bacterium]|nr:DNA alkylation repair protein [Bacteroidia bacterium]